MNGLIGRIEDEKTQVGSPAIWPRLYSGRGSFQTKAYPAACEDEGEKFRKKGYISLSLSNKDQGLRAVAPGLRRTDLGALGDVGERKSFFAFTNA